MHQKQIFDESSNSFYYLEYKLKNPKQSDEIKTAITPFLTGQSVKVVVGFGVEVCQGLFEGEYPEKLITFPDYKGPNTSMPGTQNDLLFWIHSQDEGANFQMALRINQALKELGSLELEERGFTYLDSRDLTGFVDGSANPKEDKRFPAALIPQGKKGENGSYMMTQKWVHDLEHFNKVPVPTQEKIIGRTKEDSIELEGDEMPEDSHVSRTDVKVDGIPYKIYRRSAPFGTIKENGLFFIAFSCELVRFETMLERMVGQGGPQDQIMNYSRAVSGSYWFCPSQTLLDATFGG